MMVLEERTNSLFPSDLFLQPGEQPAVTSQNLAAEMLEAYRTYGIFAHCSSDARSAPSRRRTADRERPEP
jgi:hypothetical protein